MGLWEFLQQWRGGRAVAGIAASLLLHGLLVAAVLLGVKIPLAERWRATPGDALIVELAKPEERATAGSPDVPNVPPRPPSPEVPAAPPAPPVAVKSPPPPTPAPVRREAPAPRQVASAARAPERAPEPARPAAQPVEAPRAVAPTPAESPAESGVEQAAAAPTSPTPRIERVPSASRMDGSNTQVASLPPGAQPGAPAAPDIRSALRRGAGGRGEGRGGIVGTPIPLDTPDPKFHEFLIQVKRQIESKLTYPCIRVAGTFDCEAKDTEVVVHFGILKTGRLQYVELWVASPWSIYDDASMIAVRLAQPFPPVPPAILASLEPGTTGIPITGLFRFHVTLHTLVR